MRDRSLRPTTMLTGGDLADAGLPVAFHRRDLEAALRCSARSASDLIRRLTDEGTIVPVKYKRDRPKKQRLYALAGEEPPFDQVVDMQLRVALIPDDVLVAELARRFLEGTGA